MYEKNWYLCPLAVKQGGIFCLSSSKKQRKPWILVRKNVPLQPKSNATNMKRIKMPLLAKVKTPLLARIIIAIILGVVFGNFFNEAAVRAFLTFNGIFSQFLGMTFSGEAYHILLVFAQIILVILVLHIVILLYEYLLAGGLTHKNPFKLLLNMLPAYFTALGTSSSAATIPVTLKQTLKNGVTDGIAGFTIPLCATIHLSGSMMKITCCALTICLINGLPCNLPLFLNFIFVLAICMVAAPGVPGGAVMAALGPLASVLGFNADMQALMIALYIAMDSFGTACNVTGDGAIAVVVDKIFRKDK